MARITACLAALTALCSPCMTSAQQTCVLCNEPSDDADKPVSIEIFSDLVFSRLALTGRGEASVALDPQTGQKQVSGVVDLGGQAIQGRARITGARNRAVRVILPSSVTMTSQTGGTAQLVDFITDLPPWPVLDSAGVLEFSFGGTLVLKGTVGGPLRGRIPISVEYN